MVVTQARCGVEKTLPAPTPSRGDFLADIAEPAEEVTIMRNFSSQELLDAIGLRRNRSESA